MQPVAIHSALHIAQSPGMGWGVFTSRPIPASTWIETSPVVVMPAEQRSLLDQTRLHDYIFEWGNEGEEIRHCCMALGYIAVYNHAVDSNCEYVMDLEAGLIRVRTVRDVQAGEELFINYNGDAGNDRPVWFRDIKKRAR
jgi:SET domain-containing protein